MAKLHIITGVSGTGKSTVAIRLKNELPKEQYVVYDFDEIGVPEDPDKKWRKEQTEIWLVKTFESDKEVVIAGLMQPDEVMASPRAMDIETIRFILLDASDKDIRQRLEERYGDNKEQFIQDTINYAKMHRELAREYDVQIVDTAQNSIQETVQQVIHWIKNA